MHGHPGKHGLLGIAIILACVSQAHAQAYDFATCSPGAVPVTACNSTITRCCKQAAGTGSSILRSGTDYAIVIPMDYCHQAGSASPTDGSAPTWCSKPTSPGGMVLAYGLVYRLLQNGIPVYWYVNPSKDPVALGATNGTSAEIPSDIDLWVMDAAATTPPATGTALTACSGCTPPVKHWTLSSTGTFAVDAAWTYDKKQFPIRGSAFLIRAVDRANFNKFVRRQAPYNNWAAGRSCGSGTSCQDFSGIEFFEIQPSASLGWTDFTVSGAGGATGFRAGEGPVADVLNYSPGRIAREGVGGVAQKWLGSANLEDQAAAACRSSTFSPPDSVFCAVDDTDIANGTLVSGNFGWLWLDHSTPACGATMTNIRTFLVPQTGVRAAGNVMAIANGLDQETSCSNQQLLGNEVASYGLDTSASGSPPAALILRYPANLMLQWGDHSPDFAAGQGGPGFTYSGGSSNGYNPAFTSGVNPNSLHRLVTDDASSGANTICLNQKSSATCDVYGGASGDDLDLASYGRFQNGTTNGIVFYLPGTQIHNHTSELRMLLDALLATPTGVIPINATATEVSRNAPIVAAVGGNTAVVQGTYENVSPNPLVPTFTVASDAAGFRFPYLKGHLRARTASTITTTASTFGSSGVLFDAASNIPGPTYAGCGTYFTSSCRTVFTTLATGSNPAIHYLQSSELGNIGPAMAADLTSSDQARLIQRVLAGDDSATSGTFVPKLGGVDRSTVAVIGTSSVVSTTRPTIAYFGATDGMLHAVCASVGAGCDVLGREMWAYVPRTQLSTLRYNVGRIDGAPHVFDAFGDWANTGIRTWKTVLTFQTGSGDPTASDRVPAIYALDVSNPLNPTVLWEYTLANAASRAVVELGVGLTLASGSVKVSGVSKTLVFAQTNNGGTGGAGSIVTAIDVVTGGVVWQKGAIYPAPRTATNAAVQNTGIPGGAVAVDKTGVGDTTDLVLATLYGDLWELDPATGNSRYGSGSDIPLFRFSTDYHPIGGKPAIYSNSNQLFAVITSGGYDDPADSTWDGNQAQSAVAIKLSTPTADATINENQGAPDVPFKIDFGAGEKGSSQALIVGNELFLTTDTADINAIGYGTSGATGHMYRFNLSTNAAGATVVLAGGATSVANSATTLYAGASDKTQQLGTGASSTTGTSVDPIQGSKMYRKLWVRTQ
ncbi:MAG: Type fimbrial biosis protein PilY1 [Myxococcales bacterium]|nr:Type fimbrial biosis protein PilY1 [Myxococcales bacterium]